MTEPPPHGPPQWGYPQQPPSWGRPTSTVAIVAIVLTFVFFPAGFVLGIVALSQIKRTGEDGRGLAIAAIAVSSVFAVMLAAAIAFFVHLGLSGEFDDDPIGHLREIGSTEVGSCLRLPSDESTSRVVDCETVHDQEVSYVTTIAARTYPDSRTMRKLGDKTCAATFESYVGVGSFESDLSYGFYAPGPSEWLSGERRLVCVVLPGGFDERFHESQQGSGN